MKGLEKYIAKHGEHFTDELADNAINIKWSTSEIEKCSAPMVYYNNSDATSGDIAFLANLFYNEHKSHRPFKLKCIRYALSIIESAAAKGFAFRVWLIGNKDFDLEKYV